MEYTLQFFDNTGEVILEVDKYEAIQDALNYAAHLGARDFRWDGFLLSGDQELCYGGLVGTFAIIDEAYFWSLWQ